MDHFEFLTDFIRHCHQHRLRQCQWTVSLPLNDSIFIVNRVHRMCTTAMKASPTTYRSIFNEFNLPLAKTDANIQESNKLQFTFLSTPSLLPKTKVQNNSWGRIQSLRFKKQTKWIRRRRHQRVLSMRSQILSVCCASYLLYIICSYCLV